MKTIVVVGSKDTKEAEINYVAQSLTCRGFRILVLDTSTGRNYCSRADYTREQIAGFAGIDWNDTLHCQRHDLLRIMCDGLRVLTAKMYEEGMLDGIIALGGLQNTTMGSAAMLDLPIGIPKLIVSTVATGQRTFDKIVGSKDITVMPSPCDFTGVNSISSIVLDNAVAAIAGMVGEAGRTIPKSDHIRIGTTFMGATNDGVVNAVEMMQEKGYEVISFHSTGAGGMAMEELTDDGVINAVMDLTLHEVVYEYFGYGFGYCENKRLLKTIKNEIPLLVCPGGIDFMCQWPNALFDDIDTRKYIWHNPNLVHVKLRPKEAADIAGIIVSRLNEASGKVLVVIPTKGFRSYTKPGEPLYDPEVDQAIIRVFQEKLRKDIPVKYFDANFIDYEFSKFVADEMIAFLDQP